MNLVYKIGANVIFILHLILVLLVIFGWAIPTMLTIYMAALVATLASDIVFGYCILSKWEFNLRKKLNPLLDYNYTWTTFYTYKLTNHRISDNFYKLAAIIALVLSIGINLYFKFLY
jgi:hypothetical protein